MHYSTLTRSFILIPNLLGHFKVIIRGELLQSVKFLISNSITGMAVTAICR